MSKVVFKDDIKKFGDRAVFVFDQALERMAKDIKQIAKMRVPFKDGDLMKSIIEEKLGQLAHRVIVD